MSELFTIAHISMHSIYTVVTKRRNEILASGWYSRYAAGTFSKANCKMYSLLMGRPTKKCGRSPTALLQRVCPSVGCNLLLLSRFTIVANLGPK